MTGPVTTEALVARIAELEAENAQITVERNEALAMRRWNIDRTGDGEVLVCRGYHDKGEDCDHERFVPEERLATATSELARLRAEGEAKDRALKPFAECAEVFWGRDDVGVCFRQATSGTTYHEPLTIGDFRAARAATAREG